MGFSVVEVLCSLSLLGVGMLGIEASQIHTLARSGAGQTQREAVEIARDQLDYIQRLPEGQLEVHGAYAPAVWLQSPGLERGQLPNPLRDASLSRPLSVEVSAADRVGGRQFSVRVTWQDREGNERIHEVSAVHAS